MLDWEKKIQQLEEKVQILQETLETVKKMQLSAKMLRYIHSQESILKLVDLINLVSDQPELDFNQQRSSLQRNFKNKKAIDKEINASIIKSEKLLEEYSCDPKYFGFKLESGIIKSDGDNKIQINSLSPYIGKGIRITSYHGKQRGVIVIPQEIEGYPVVSIGKEVFARTRFTEIVLPTTLRAIFDDAFKDCYLLQNIVLPNGLLYLGKGCFYGCGFKSIVIPSSIQELPTFAFAHCRNLNNVRLCEGVRVIGDDAFLNCPISSITLPETIESLGGNCFSNTKLKCVAIPRGTKTVHPVAFANTGRMYLINYMVCAFLGESTTVTSSNQFHDLRGVRLIYCLPGSNMEKYAKEHLLISKPLDEFKLEDYK